jgi:hypothetical protein
MRTTAWYDGLFLLLLFVGVLFIIAMIAGKATGAHDFSVRTFGRRSVVWLTDMFFDSVVRLHLHTSLEWVSALGLLALLAGKITTAILFEGTITVRTTWLAGAILISGIYQMFAVLNKHNIEARVEASTFATATWIFVFVSLFFSYLGENSAVARVVFEYFLPLCIVFVIVSIIQTLVLIRESMHPSLSREEAFAMAVFNGMQEVFKIGDEMREDFYGIVRDTAKKFHLRK